jgi:hypothetical protein
MNTSCTIRGLFWLEELSSFQIKHITFKFS